MKLKVFFSHKCIRFGQEVVKAVVGSGLTKFIIKYYCSKMYGEEMCELLWNNYILIEIQNLVAIIDPEIYCSYFYLCKYPKIVKDRRDLYWNRILNNTPPIKKIHKKTLHDVKNPIKFLAFADPHLEFEYEEGRTAKCSSASCCRRQNEWATDPRYKAGPFGFLGSCDLPVKTIDNFMDTVISEFKPDAVLWLGDNPSHQIWNQSKQNHLEGIRHISKRFNASDYNKVGKMYPILGNHEGLPCDIFNFEGNSHRWIIEDTANYWRQWLTPEAYKEYLRIGSYSQLHPGTKLRIIGVNDLAHDSTNSYLWKNATDPWGVLQWLESTLSQSEKNGEVVLILTHMPMNGRQTANEWAARYNALVERYQNIIKGQFFGHNHEDSFELFHSITNKSEAIGYGILLPPMGVFSSHNPAFRVFYIDPETYEVIDHDTYRLYVTEANAKNKAEWKHTYRFSKYYGYDRLSLENMVDLHSKLGVNQEITNRFVKMLKTENPSWKNTAKNLKKVQYIKCRAGTGYFEQMDECINKTYPSTKDFLRYKLINHYLIPDWTRAEHQHHSSHH